MSQVQCLLAPGLDPTVRRALEAYFACTSDIEVVADRRGSERRRNAERRRTIGGEASERRRIHNLSGRRIGERRAELVALPIGSVASLPAPMRSLADQVRFVERRAASAEVLSDNDDLRLVARLQAGDDSAFDAIYERYLSRLHIYARAAVGDAHEAEDVAHEVLIKMLQAVPDYEIRGIPFRIWLFRVVRNHVRNHLAKHARVNVEDPDTVNGHLETGRTGRLLATLDQQMFERFANDDFMRMIDGLSAPQRQVLALRYLLGFELTEIATLLRVSPNAAANIQYRALGSLRSERQASASFGRVSFAMRRAPRFGSPIESRRAALHPFGC